MQKIIIRSIYTIASLWLCAVVAAAGCSHSKNANPLPKLSIATTPEDKSLIGEKQAITLLFNRSVEGTTLYIEGSLAANWDGQLNWSRTNYPGDTLTLRPAEPGWLEGKDHTLVIRVADSKNASHDFERIFSIDASAPAYTVTPLNGANLGATAKINVTFNETINADDRFIVNGSMAYEAYYWAEDAASARIELMNQDADAVKKEFLKLIIEPAGLANPPVRDIKNDGIWVNGQDKTLEIYCRDATGHDVIDVDALSKDGQSRLPYIRLTYNIDSTPPTFTVDPKNGIAIEQSKAIQLTFTEEMRDVGLFQFSGDLAPEIGEKISARKNHVNDTLIIKPAGLWSTGTKTLLIKAFDKSDNMVLIELRYRISAAMPQIGFIKTINAPGLIERSHMEWGDANPIKITAKEELAIKFSNTMNAASLKDVIINGQIPLNNATFTWMQTDKLNDTLTIKMSEDWQGDTYDDLRLTFYCEDLFRQGINAAIYFKVDTQSPSKNVTLDSDLFYIDQDRSNVLYNTAINSAKTIKISFSEEMAHETVSLTGALASSALYNWQVIPGANPQHVLLIYPKDGNWPNGENNTPKDIIIDSTLEDIAGNRLTSPITINVFVEDTKPIVTSVKPVQGTSEKNFADYSGYKVMSGDWHLRVEFNEPVRHANTNEFALTSCPFDSTQTTNNCDQIWTKINETDAGDSVLTVKPKTVIDTYQNGSEVAPKQLIFSYMDMARNSTSYTHDYSIAVDNEQPRVVQVSAIGKTYDDDNGKTIIRGDSPLQITFSEPMQNEFNQPTGAIVNNNYPPTYSWVDNKTLLITPSNIYSQGWKDTGQILGEITLSSITTDLVEHSIDGATATKNYIVDATRPTVSITPASGSILNGSNNYRSEIVLTFSEPMDTSSVTTTISGLLLEPNNLTPQWTGSNKLTIKEAWQIDGALSLSAATDRVGYSIDPLPVSRTYSVNNTVPKYVSHAVNEGCGPTNDIKKDILKVGSSLTVTFASAVQETITVKSCSFTKQITCSAVRDSSDPTKVNISFNGLTANNDNATGQITIAVTGKNGIPWEGIIGVTDVNPTFNFKVNTTMPSITVKAGSQTFVTTDESYHIDQKQPIVVSHSADKELYNPVFEVMNSGIGGITFTGSHSNTTGFDEYTISPPTVGWTTGGSKQLSLRYNDATGCHVDQTLNYTLHVLDGNVYVAAGATGNGTYNEPFGSIQDAVDLAEDDYPCVNNDCSDRPIKTINVSTGTFGTTATSLPIVSIEKNGIKLVGGYSYVSETHEWSASSTKTIIKNTVATGGSDSSPAATITISGTDTSNPKPGSTTSIENFAIQAPSNANANYATGLYIKNTATGQGPRIANNSISGYNTNTNGNTDNRKYSYAVLLHNAAAEINANSINAADSGVGDYTDSYGIYLKNCQGSAPVKIYKNTIIGGRPHNNNSDDSTNNYYAVYAALDSSAKNTYTAVIYNNILNGAINSYSNGNDNNSYGVYLADNSSSYNMSVALYNNIISGGNADNAYGIYVNSASPIIRNNTITASGDNASYGLYSLNGSNPTIENNIIYLPSGTTSENVYIASSSGRPAVFAHNDLFAATNAKRLYYEHNTTPAQAVSVYGTDFLTAPVTVNGASQPLSGLKNVNLDPKFTDITEGVFTLSLDSPVFVKFGGKKPSGIDCVSTCAAGEACYPLCLLCKDASDPQVVRTAFTNYGWSMGAYEWITAPLALTSITHPSGVIETNGSEFPSTGIEYINSEHKSQPVYLEFNQSVNYKLSEYATGHSIDANSVVWTENFTPEINAEKALSWHADSTGKPDRIIKIEPKNSSGGVVNWGDDDGEEKDFTMDLKLWGEPLVDRITANYTVDVVLPSIASKNPDTDPLLLDSNTPVTLTLSEPINRGQILSPAYLITVNDFELTDNFSITNDRQVSITPGSNSFTTWFTGANTIAINMQDLAGNRATPTATYYHDSTPPEATVTVEYVDNNTITKSFSKIFISFNEEMDPKHASNSLIITNTDSTLTYTNSACRSWNADNTVLTISPTGCDVVGNAWKDGTLNLSFQMYNASGVQMAALTEKTYIVSASSAPVIIGVTPAAGSVIDYKQDIVIQFSASMNTGSCSISGDGDGGLGSNKTLTWSQTTSANDTLTISPYSNWTEGSSAEHNGRSLTVANCKDTASPTPNTLETVTLRYHVLNGALYVTTTSGNDTYKGTIDSPVASIDKGVQLAQSYKTSSGINIVIKVAAGEYTTPSGITINTDGIQLLGGYNSDWTVRDSSLYATSITSTSANRGNATHPAATISFDGTKNHLTSHTMVEGFVIHASQSQLHCSVFYPCHAAAVAVYENAAPLIAHNKIHGVIKDDDYVTSYGIYVLSNDVPDAHMITINNNLIDAHGRGTAAASADTRSTGIYISDNSNKDDVRSQIYNNIINGGTYQKSVALHLAASAAIVRNNTLLTRGSVVNTDPDAYSYTILLDGASQPVIQNNIIAVDQAGTSTNARFCIFENGTGTAPVVVSNNVLWDYDAADVAGSSAFIYCKQCSLTKTSAGTKITAEHYNSAENIYHVTFGSETSNLKHFKNVILDPQFNNYAADNFNLTLASPVYVKFGGINGQRNNLTTKWPYSTDYSGSAPRSGLLDTSNPAVSTSVYGWSMGAFEWKTEPSIDSITHPKAGDATYINDASKNNPIILNFNQPLNFKLSSYEKLDYPINASDYSIDPKANQYGESNWSDFMSVSGDLKSNVQTIAWNETTSAYTTLSINGVWTEADSEKAIQLKFNLWEDHLLSTADYDFNHQYTVDITKPTYIANPTAGDNAYLNATSVITLTFSEAMITTATCVQVTVCTSAGSCDEPSSCISNPDTDDDSYRYEWDATAKVLSISPETGTWLEAYSITVSVSGLTDLARNQPEPTISLTYGVDITGPGVLSFTTDNTAPADYINAATTAIVISFNESMDNDGDPNILSSITVTDNDNSTSCAYSATWSSDSSISITPHDSCWPADGSIITINSFTASDKAGNTVSVGPKTFTVDRTAPDVHGTVNINPEPDPSTGNIESGTTVTVTFNEPMDTSNCTVTSSNDYIAVTSVWQFDNLTVILTLTNSSSSQEATVTITCNDKAGNQISGGNKQFTYTVNAPTP